MQVKKVRDKTFTLFISEKEILQKIKQLAEEINEDYKNKKPLFIAVLNGSFMFAADLFKELTVDAEISFIKLSSYKGAKSGGQVVSAIGLNEKIEGRDIILLEDILDTGKTLNEFLPQILIQRPASLKIAVLLHKKEATAFPVHADYIGFIIPDKFVIGYGLDYNGSGRNFKDLYQLKQNI